MVLSNSSVYLNLFIKNYYEREALQVDHQFLMYKACPIWERIVHLNRFGLIANLLNVLNPVSLLDVGCAEGLYIRTFLKNSKSARYGVGVDIAKEYLLKAKNKNRSVQAEFVQVSATKLPFKDNVFNIALCSEVLEHVPNPKEALNELLRVAGSVVLSIPQKSLFSKLFLALRKFFFFNTEMNAFSQLLSGHINEINLSQITSWIPGRVSLEMQVIGWHIFPFHTLQLVGIKLPEKLAIPFFLVDHQIYKLLLKISQSFFDNGCVLILTIKK